MKAVSPATALVVLSVAVAASADDRFITPQLEHAWQVEGPQIERDVTSADILLGICDDGAFRGAIQQRFLQLDRESMALYNRGIAPAAPAVPNVPVTGPPRAPAPRPDGPSTPRPPTPPTRTAAAATGRVRTR